ncbi:hypothetical protein V1387_07395 [Allomuricauda taeanensis]|uniref:hypothetical protein n=1 Tax=Flagellimonas taeanensis TaxID=1005926 RepID=UPI002E7ADA57|nr:hypothetical protein [Allomuricauda taeanensis]MEE1962505.1 hypothetical protein [Allomuricauda taeanensis]
MKANRTPFFSAQRLFFMMIMVLVISCENESLIEQRSVGDLDTGPLSIEGYDLEVDANNYGSLVSGEGETKLYRTTVSGTETGEPIQDPYFSFYVKVGPDGERTVLKAIPNEQGGSFSLDGKTNTFNGTVVEYGSNGAPKVLKVFERGTLIDESPLHGAGKGRELSGREFWEPLRDWDDPNYGGRVSIFVERYTDVYFDRNGNGIPELSEYGYPVYNGGGWEYVEYGHQDYIPISNDAFHRHDWRSGGPSTALTHNAEEIINNLTGKAKCVYDKLSMTKSMQELLADFFGNDAEFDLTLQLVPNLVCGDSDSPSGCTSANYDHNSKKVVISIDKDYADNYSLLVIGKTIVHEVIHANLFLAVKKLNGGMTPNNTNFEALYEQYRNQKGWQHEFMSNHYVDLMAEALEEFHSQLNDDVFKSYYDNWDWDDFYTKLAWTGLKNTTKGQTYYELYEDQISIYYEAAKVNSTKTMDCN